MTKPTQAPALAPATLPQLAPIPGAPAPGDQTALRCPNCNRVVLVVSAYVECNAGATCLCPLCGGACSLPG